MEVVLFQKGWIHSSQRRGRNPASNRPRPAASQHWCTEHGWGTGLQDDVTLSQGPFAGSGHQPWRPGPTTRRQKWLTQTGVAISRSIRN